MKNKLPFKTNYGELNQVEIKHDDYVYLYNPINTSWGFSTDDHMILDPKNWVIGQFGGIEIDERRRAKYKEEEKYHYSWTRKLWFKYRQHTHGSLHITGFIPADDFNLKDMEKSIKNIVVLINDKFYKGINPFIFHGDYKLEEVQDEQARKAGVF